MKVANIYGRFQILPYIYDTLSFGFYPKTAIYSFGFSPNLHYPIMHYAFSIPNY